MMLPTLWDNLGQNGQGLRHTPQQVKRFIPKYRVERVTEPAPPHGSEVLENVRNRAHNPEQLVSGFKQTRRVSSACDVMFWEAATRSLYGLLTSPRATPPQHTPTHNTRATSL
ncbi:hypothetical protein J6590_050000 [Homalodisca vitripennis]|nr:hypothetical protein J6590_050000 [Homalodisca vitripennis]